MACDSDNGNDNTALADSSQVVAGGAGATLASGILSATGDVSAVVSLTGPAPLPNMGIVLSIPPAAGALASGSGSLSVTAAGKLGQTWTLALTGNDGPASNSYTAHYTVTFTP